MKFVDVKEGQRVRVTGNEYDDDQHSKHWLSFEFRHVGCEGTVSHVDRHDAELSVEVCFDNGMYDWGNVQHIELVEDSE